MNIIGNVKYAINNPSGKASIMAGNHNDIPETLTLMPSNFNKLIGREKELNDLDLLIDSQESPILLTGIGGIGKSSILKEFQKIKSKKFNFKIWISQDKNDLGLTIANNDQLLFNLGIIWTEGLSPESRVDAFFDKIAGLQGQNLLILDNLNLGKDDDCTQKLIYLSKSKNWKILASSREDVYGFEPYKVTPLNIEDSIKLFKKFNNESDITIIERIIEIVEYNPLGIELIAKSISENPTLNNSNKFIELIRKKNRETDLPKIRTEHTYKENDIIQHLIWLYDITKSNLTPREVWLLKQFLIFPYDSFLTINPDSLLGNLYFESKNPDFQQLFHQLEKKGWISKNYKGEKEHFQMHSIVKTALINSLTLKHPDDLLDISLDLIRLLRVNDTKINWLDSINYLEFGENVLEYLPDNHEDKAMFLDVLAGVHDLLGNVEKASKYREEALNISKKWKGYTDLSVRFHNLGNIELEKGNFKEAIRLFKKSIALKSKGNSKYFPENLMISRVHLAIAYAGRGMLAKSIVHLENIVEEYQNASSDHPRISLCNFHLALGYNYIWEFDTALEYIDKAVQQDVKMFGESDFRLATKLNLLAKILANMGRFEDAKNVHNKCISILESCPGYFERHLSQEIATLNTFNSDVVFVDNIIDENEENIIRDVVLYPEINPSTIRLLYVGWGYANLYSQKKDNDYLFTSIGMIYHSFARAKANNVERKPIPFVINAIIPDYRHVIKIANAINYMPIQIAIEERTKLFGKSGMPDSNSCMSNLFQMVLVSVSAYFAFNRFGWLGCIVSILIIAMIWNVFTWAYRKYILYGLKKT